VGEGGGEAGGGGIWGGAGESHGVEPATPCGGVGGVGREGEGEEDVVLELEGFGVACGGGGPWGDDGSWGRGMGGWGTGVLEEGGGGDGGGEGGEEGECSDGVLGARGERAGHEGEVRSEKWEVGNETGLVGRGTGSGCWFWLFIIEF